MAFPATRLKRECEDADYNTRMQLVAVSEPSTNQAKTVGWEAVSWCGMILGILRINEKKLKSTSVNNKP